VLYSLLMRIHQYLPGLAVGVLALGEEAPALVRKSAAKKSFSPL
jgi:hypothetical protein